MTNEKILTTREKAIIELIKTIEHVDPMLEVREGIRDTPLRVARMYNEIFSGYEQDPKEILGTTFTEDQHQEMVIVRNIQFYSHCEHHMVPFFGKVHIGYIPKGKIVGISKLVRLVECFGKRLQIQERMTSQIADTIDEILQPLGVIVVIDAEHLCMKMRGVENPCADTVTSAVRGLYRDASQARAKFLSHIAR